MQHGFDIEVATKYGVNIAIFLNNLAFWIKKNQASDKHYYKDNYWTYNSSEAFSILFPYWSTDQIDRLIKKCVSLNLVIIDNFNEKAYDRTRWYALTDVSCKLLNLTLPRNRGNPPAKSRKPSREIAEPIPNINTDINTDIKSSCSSDDERSINNHFGFDKFWDVYPRKQAKKKAQAVWIKNKLHLKYQEIVDAVIDQKANQVQWRNKQFIPLPATYLNGERWNDEIEIEIEQGASSKFNMGEYLINSIKKDFKDAQQRSTNQSTFSQVQAFLPPKMDR